MIKKIVSFLLVFGLFVFIPSSHAVDTVDSTTLYGGGSKKYVIAFTNHSDGTGESNIQKVDISGLVGAPTAVKINRIVFSVSDAMSVKIAFDHTTDDVAAIVTGAGKIDFTPYGGLVDPGSTGGTGDILFTTIDHEADATYFVLLELDIS